MDSLQDLSTSNKIEHEIVLSSLPPTPSKSSTAFTIEFDDLNNNQLKNQRKKAFERDSLRESLRKYAPEKLEKLTKIKQKDEKQEDEIKIENANASLSDGASFLIQKMFSGQKSTKAITSSSKSAVNKSTNQIKSENKLSQQQQQQLNKSKSLSCKSTPLKLRNFNNNNNSFLTNNTSLINNTSIISNQSFRSPTLEMDSGVCVADDESSFLIKCDENEDALSETGTYTVELDNQDPIAEEARKRINEIFGVKGELPSSLTKQQLDSLSNCSSSISSRKANSKSSFKISSIKKVYKNENEDNRIRHNSIRNSIKNELEHKNSNSSTERLSFRNRRSSLQSSLKRQDSFRKSSGNKLSGSKSVSNNVSNSNSKPNNNSSSLTEPNKKSQLNQNINLINQNNTFVFNCNNNNNSSSNSNSLLNRARANSITRSLTKKMVSRKDQLKDDDTNSIKSDEAASTAGSTDLSSMNSEKCKSDNGQNNYTSLRFNRAFALRRARLGIDTPPITKNNNKINNNSRNSKNSKPNNHHQVSHIPINNQSRSSSQCSAIEYLDRSDGGRYSLRASASKPPICNQTFTTSKLSSNNNHKSISNNLIKQGSSSSLINAISASKDKVANKLLNKNSSNKTNVNCLNQAVHIRANSFGGTNNGNSPSLSLVNKTMNGNANNQLLKQQHQSRLSSAASTSSNNTMSNASTNEDLSNASDPIKVKNYSHLSPFQLGRRIYSTKPHYIAQSNSFRNRLEENGGLHQNNSENSNGIDDHPQTTSTFNQFNQTSELPATLLSEKKKFGQLTVSNSNSTFNSYSNANSSNGNSCKSLSALDYLVLSAVSELSFKLRCKLRSILDAEKSKYPLDNENRILIEELLPQVNLLTEYRNSETTSEKTISRDLSNVLKNLKRIEQSLEGSVYFII